MCDSHSSEKFKQLENALISDPAEISRTQHAWFVVNVFVVSFFYVFFFG